MHHRSGRREQKVPAWETDDLNAHLVSFDTESLDPLSYLLNKVPTPAFLAHCEGKHDLTFAITFRELARSPCH